MIHIDYQARMTRYLVSKGQFRDNKIVVVDVGARGGAHPCWNVLQDQVEIIGFEPDKEECERINSEHGVINKCLPFALHRDRGRREFFIARVKAASSFYGNGELFSQAENYEDNLPVSSVFIDTVDFDSVCQEYKIDDVDFIKLDVEGAELDVLYGARQALAQKGILGVESEVRFQKLPPAAPAFSDVDLFLREYGFHLFDLDAYRLCRRALLFPGVYDNRDDNGKPVPGATAVGQVMVGDALFFRDLVRISLAGNDPLANGPKLLKLACLYEIFGLPDCAAEVLVHFRTKLEGDVDTEHLLNLLTPEIFSKNDTYAHYMEEGRKAFYRSEGRMLASHNAPFTTTTPSGIATNLIKRDLQRNLISGKPSPITYLRILLKLLLGYYRT
jgi:FkbM family methyltransferase